MMQEIEMYTPCGGRLRTGMRLGFRGWIVVFGMLAGTLAAHAADGFKQPTKEELEMKSLPGYPGVAAVVLYREQITKDDLHEDLHYERIKVLTEEGKKYANVSLGFVQVNDFQSDYNDETTLGEIVGRTVHADGTVVPFTGKPYLKVVVKGSDHDFDYKVQEKIFTLPDVEVGSIIEYRYTKRINDHTYEPPTWLIQGDLFVKSAHYEWYATSVSLELSGGGIATRFSWYSMLPAGDKIESKSVMKSAGDPPQQIYSITVKDIPPLSNVRYQLPPRSHSYRVFFSYTQYAKLEAYWKEEGNEWSRHMNSFVNPNGQLKQETSEVTAGAKTEQEKLHKIYDVVMSYENTDYTRGHTRAEDKAEGLRKVNNTADVFLHKRGSSTELTELFVGMARAAGMKAYLMLVPDRSQELFTSQWMSFRQFDDMIAIVNVDGAELPFDPGSRYCDFGRLAWEHTYVEGLRQTANGSELGRTPADFANDNITARVANLAVDDAGAVSGTIQLNYVGSPALEWRQKALRGDEESLRYDLRKSLEAAVPKSLEVEVLETKGLTGYDSPVSVSFSVKGTIGSKVGSRLVLPVDLFRVNASSSFPEQAREEDVYFPYQQRTQDAIRIVVPAKYTPEGIPKSAKLVFDSKGSYDMTVSSTANSFTVRRNYAYEEILTPASDYPKLRTFYSQMEAQDQESVVFHTGS